MLRSLVGSEMCIRDRVSTEDDAKIVQLDVHNGSVMITTPSLADHVMGLGLDWYRHDYGSCNDDGNGNFGCTGSGASHPGGNMPAEFPRGLACTTDCECQPFRVNRSYAVAETVSQSCDFQAVLKMKNSTERLHDAEGDLAEGQGAGEVLLEFDGWLRDVGLKNSSRVLQIHPTLGLLVSVGNQIVRYDLETGQFKQTVLELESGGEVTCFHLE
eukprot:TRINITY_DN13215_c0_g1_i9.p1 TRINITY_DN13215_c0_g1~~TRINITY_DN13215_c0_g1_i9.p1  ORF type:complete len:247 (-),score=100.42 TRINITY_DN13215_c0_g1_i9:180-821(-)